MLFVIIIISLVGAAALLYIVSLCRAAAWGDEWERDRLNTAQARAIRPGHVARIYAMARPRFRTHSRNLRPF